MFCGVMYSSEDVCRYKQEYKQAKIRHAKIGHASSGQGKIVLVAQLA